MTVSAAAWGEIRASAFAASRAGIDAQRAIADEMDRRAAGATGKRWERLTSIAVEARAKAAATEAALGGMITARRRG